MKVTKSMPILQIRLEKDQQKVQGRCQRGTELMFHTQNAKNVPKE